MRLTQSAVEALLRRGHFQEIASDKELTPARVNALPSMDHRLAIAEALLRAGQIETAKRIVNAISTRNAPPDVRCRCEMLLGLAAREIGAFDEASRHLHASVRVAKDAGFTSGAAWSLLTTLRLVAERQPREVVSSLLQEVRNLVTRAGEPHLTALLHESVARYEAQLGNLDEARRHLKVATSLLLSYPNAWVEQLVAVNEFCVEFSDCNLAKAEERLRRAEDLEHLSGSLSQTIANNLGHLQLQIGKFDLSEQILRETANRNVGEVLQSALDGLARLYLAQGRLDESEHTLNVLSEVVKTIEPLSSFPFRSSLVTRIRLLLKQCKWQEARETAEKAIAESLAVQDVSVLALGHALRAIAVSKQGRHKDAAISISKSIEVGARSLREHQGLIFELCSQLIVDADATLATLWFRRAKRIWKAQGNFAAQTEFREFGQALDKKIQDDQNPIPSDIRERRLAGLVSALSSLFDVSYQPELAGFELKNAIEELACSARVQVRTGESTIGDGQLSVDLGVAHNGRLKVVCDIPDDPLKAILLGDVLRIGKAAIALERAREEERNRAALWPADPVEEQGDTIFLAEEMQALLATVRRIAPTTVPVLITGETGTGKEVLARTIHACSTRAKNIFLPFNCASTPKDMLDSQLFGHRRGAFTGAVEHFQGVVRAASGGTLFLDEIGDMSLDVQPKLLRFLDAREVHAVGEAQPTRVDVRVIVATNADLDRLVADGRFRDDLFYRLSIVPLHIPPLRERRVEIPTLANHYLRKHAQEYGKGDLRLSEDTMEYLVLYKWPGNVRQLASEMRRVAALAETDAVIMPEHLSREIAASRRTIPASERTLDANEVVVRLDQPMAAATRYLEQVMVQYALKRCGGRVEDTAAMLGISRKGLYLKRQRFGIDAPDSASALAG
jgi:DNA-binding NtrC family response regulator